MTRTLAKIALVGAAVMAVCGASPQPYAAQKSRTAPANGGSMFDAEAVAGCYELKFSPWTPSSNHGQFEGWGELPTKIRLTTEQTPKPADPAGFIALAMSHTASRPSPWHYWKVKSATTIEVLWSNGFSGWAMELTVASDTLKGKAWTFWDFAGTTQKADVTAIKFGCPASAPAK